MNSLKEWVMLGLAIICMGLAGVGAMGIVVLALSALKKEGNLTDD